MPLAEERIEIELDKKKLFLMLIGALIFVSIGFWFVISPPTIQNAFLGNPSRIAIIGYASIIFSGLCVFFLIQKLFDNKPGLIIDKNGIVDNSVGSPRIVLWSEIESISVVNIHRQKLILIHIKNPQDYIVRQTNGFKRKMMAMNYKMYDAPISMRDR